MAVRGRASSSAERAGTMWWVAVILEGMAPSGPPIDPLLGLPVEVQVVHPFQARKAYTCPGCDHTIDAGVGHVVAVPIGAADLRRHWHRPCWEHRMRRRPGRR